MYKNLLLFLFLFSISCSGTNKMTTPKNWTFDVAVAHFENMRGVDYPKISEESRWLDNNLVCDSATSASAIPEEGPNVLHEMIGYPSELRRNRIEGEIIAEFVVLENGTVDQISFIKSGHHELRRVVKEGIEDTRFVPAFCNQVPTSSINRIEMSFILQQ